MPLGVDRSSFFQLSGGLRCDAVHPAVLPALSVAFLSRSRAWFPATAARMPGRRAGESRLSSPRPVFGSEPRPK